MIKKQSEKDWTTIGMRTSFFNAFKIEKELVFCTDEKRAETFENEENTHYEYVEFIDLVYQLSLLKHI